MGTVKMTLLNVNDDGSAFVCDGGGKMCRTVDDALVWLRQNTTGQFIFIGACSFVQVTAVFDKQVELVCRVDFLGFNNAEQAEIRLRMRK